MPTMYVDLDKLRESKKSPILLSKAAAKLLFKVKDNFLSSSETYCSKKSRILNPQFSLSKVKFSHHLVRSGINQWHVIENKSKGDGGFGSVNESKLKITVEKYKNSYSAQLTVVKDVVKILRPSKTTPQEQLYNLARKEAGKQRNHDVNVIDVVDAGDKVIIIVEDCGISLDNLLPFDFPWEYSFKLRLAIAARIATEMLLLQQNGVVHRDLKPANICYKALLNDNFQIIFIDFGLANDITSIENKEISGTASYMAPEVLDGKGSTYASDMYALAAILGEIFGANDILKYKIEAYSKRRIINDAIDAPYCFDGLFEGYDLTGIDPCLLEDLKTFLNQLESKDPNLRPTIHELNKFLITFPGRVDEYEVFNTTWKNMETLFKQFENYHHELHLLNTRHALAQLRLNHIQGETRKLNRFSSEMINNREAIYKALSKLPLPKSHVNLAKQLIKENRLVDFAEVDNPYPELKPIIAMLEKENLKFQKALFGLERCTEAFFIGRKFTNTNSSGVIKILSILRSQATPIEKLEQLQKIGAAKTEKGFFYYFSHSCLFGWGRHKNVEELYKKLALINPENIVNKEEYLAQSQLDEITEFIIHTDTFTY